MQKSGQLKHRQHSGFTIVELLIVIVAYNGVQNRSKSASYKSAATIIIKKAEIYKVSHGVYPTATHLTTTDFYTGDASPDITAQLTGIVDFYYDEAIAGSPLTTTSPYDYASVKSAADGTFPGLPDKSYVGTRCGSGTGFKVMYPDPTNSSNVMITTGSGC